MNVDLKNAFDKVLKEIIPFNIAREEEQKQFNILKAVRTNNDEVKLHSRMISSLLDPNAPHGLGKEPLRLFLKLINAEHIDEIVEDKDATLKIQPNYQNKKENEEMDILITTKEYAVLIENKIWAGDSNKTKDCFYENGDHKGKWKRKGQLERYYALLVNEGNNNNVYGNFKKDNIQVVYLTVDEHNPSRESTGEIREVEGDPHSLKFADLPKKIKKINYREHVLKWLNKLLEIENIDSSIKTIIKQYAMTVNELTDVTERINIVKAIGSLSDQERTALASLFDSKKQKHISWHIADFFFQELYKKIEETGLSMYIKKNDAKGEPIEVKDIYESMPQILNEKKYDVNIYFEGGKPLTYRQGVITLDGLRIDFNNLTCVDTLHISNAEKRRTKVEEVLEKMKGK